MRPRTLNRRHMYYRAVRLKMPGFLCLPYLYATESLQVWGMKDCKVIISSGNKGYKDLGQKVKLLVLTMCISGLGTFSSNHIWRI